MVGDNRAEAESRRLALRPSSRGFIAGTRFPDQEGNDGEARPEERPGRW